MPTSWWCRKSRGTTNIIKVYHLGTIQYMSVQNRAVIGPSKYGPKRPEPDRVRAEPDKYILIDSFLKARTRLQKAVYQHH